MKTTWQVFGRYVVIAILYSATSLIAADIQSLERSFNTPPDDARMMVRWWWFGPAVTKPQLEREMNLMKQGGIGGFEVQPTYPLALDGELPGLKNFKLMSPEHLDALKFTAAKAKELGLRMDLTLGSGWPYGGSQFSRAEAVGAIHDGRPITVSPGQTSVALPSRSNDEDKIIAAVLGPVTNAAPGTSLYVPLEISGNTAVLPANFHGATQVNFYTLGLPGLVKVKRPAFGGDGYIIDHYNPAAIGRFIKEIGEPAIKACEPNPPYAIFCDSLEVAGENWSPNFLAEFKQRRGYDLQPWLPALFNDAGPKTLDIRHDWGQTATEVFNDRFNGAFKKLAAANKTRYRIQGYGTPPAALFSYASCDLPEGEGYNWKGFTTARWAASASHLLGKPVTSSETFTWLHSTIFLASPLDMKAEADMHFLSGVNQIICHGWPYTPEGVAYPGWSFYAAAVFNEKNPWWIVMPDVTKYLQRVCHVLRQGTPANDVALFLPNSDAWSNLGRSFSMNSYFQPKVSGLVRAITDAGYNLDFFDDQLLEMRGKVTGKTLAFGDVRYRAVVLPGVERILPETMRKLEKFARNGGIVIATKRIPDLAPGFKTTEKDTRIVRDIAQHLFKGPNALGIFIEDENQLGAALTKRLAPDMAVSPAVPEIGATHRHTDSGEIYFVANTGNQSRNVAATFRVHGMQAESWNPMNGTASPLAITSHTSDTTTVDLNLAPYGSTMVIFTKRKLPAHKNVSALASAPSSVDLSSGWTVRFDKDSQPMAMEKLQSWTDLENRKTFSGVATYDKKIMIAPELTKPGLTLSLDFGTATPAPPSNVGRDGGERLHAALNRPVREAAVVYVNGQRAGAMWVPPYAVDVTGKLKAGENDIRVEVANLAVNYMSGIKLPNYNYEGVTKEFGNRFQPQNLGLIQPQPSGLLGPIRLIAGAVESK